MTGLAWIAETGMQSGPICLTNTHAIGIAHAGVIGWIAERHPKVAEAWLLPVVSETWDGYLNDINGAHVTEDTVRDALEAAHAGPLEEGSVGGGTGMCCYEFKGGTGTASRRVDEHTVGVLVQANFGSRRELTIAGVRLGEILEDDNPLGEVRAGRAGARDAERHAAGERGALVREQRGVGDLFLALSTGNAGAFAGQDLVTGTFDQETPRSAGELRFLLWPRLDAYFEAVVQATEEAVLNALVANDDMTGFRGHRVPALPRERVRAAMP